MPMSHNDSLLLEKLDELNSYFADIKRAFTLTWVCILVFVLIGGYVGRFYPVVGVIMSAVVVVGPFIQMKDMATHLFITLEVVHSRSGAPLVEKRFKPPYQWLFPFRFPGEFDRLKKKLEENRRSIIKKYPDEAL